jgi:hypothetical protein
LVPVDFEEQSGRVYPGMLAQVRIHCHWRTAGWWLWRAIATTLELNL